ncbi:MAG: hypothetical protein II991_06935 [Bacteroidales bacterium]|nr:hypothetical protein [Bacteroidales bacterium]
MRKTFKMFCVAALSLLAVSSCYDDSSLWNEFDSVHGEIDDLKAKIEALEKKLNDEVATLNTKIGNLEAAYKAADAELLKKLTDGDAALAASLETLTEELDALDGVVDGYITSNDAALKAAIEELKKADEALKAVDTEVLAALAGVNVINVDKNEAGDVVITFADKSTVTVPANPATGIVTVVDGKWAVVVNGEVTPLEAEVNPDTKLAFKVVENVLNVSYDGGETWVPTGAVVNDDTTINVVEGFEYNEGDPYLTLTVGGKEYTLPVYKADTSSLVLGRTDFFLRYEGSKKVELKAEGMEEYYVMNEPDGWKAVIDGTTLKVTAPTKKAIEIGAAEAEGLILVHGTTAEGKCKVAKVAVKAGPGLTLAVDINGNVTIENSYYGESVNEWTGETSFRFSDFILGLATPSLFHEDPEAYVQVYNDTWSAPSWDDIIFPSAYNIAQQGIYVEGEYETDIVKTTVADAYFMMFYEELPVGANYVVWVAPADGEGKAVIEDMVYTDYVNIKWNVAVKETTHSDITLTAEVAGASKFIINAVAESSYNTEWNPMSFDEYMNAPMGGPWNGFKSYGAAEALGLVVNVEEVPAEFKLSEILGQKLVFGENYKIWVMPVFDHLAIYDEANSMPEYDYYVYDFSAFDYEDHFLPFVLDAKTNDIVAGGAYAATLTLNRNDFTSIYVDVEVSEGTESVYYYWYTPEEFDAFESDAEIMDALFMDCYMPLEASGQVNKSYINPGDEYYLATLSIGTDGKYGEVVAEKYSTLAIPFDENIKVELVSAELDAEGKNYTVTVNVTGATKVMGYNLTHSDYYYGQFPLNVCKNGHKASYSGYQMADVVDGKAVLTFAKSTYKKDYYVAAYNVTDGVVSAISAEFVVEHLFD